MQKSQKEINVIAGDRRERGNLNNFNKKKRKRTVKDDKDK